MPLAVPGPAPGRGRSKKPVESCSDMATKSALPSGFPASPADSDHESDESDGGRSQSHVGSKNLKKWDTESELGERGVEK